MFRCTGAPTTHILKPASPDFEGLIENEALCMRLALEIGLDAAKVALGRVEGLDYLLIERYDRYEERASDGTRTLRRLHQEDFCQALGHPPNQKYQNEGGPSLKECFDLVRGVSSAPVLDLRAMLDAVVFNYLIGNHDAHGKNFSLLRRPNARGAVQTRLAPLYDLVCTTAYGQLSNKMAMKIGGEYESARVLPRHFERFAEEAGLAPRLATGRVPEMAERILAVLPTVAERFAGANSVAEILAQRSHHATRLFA